MKKLLSPEVAQDPIVNAHRGTISNGSESSARIAGSSSCLCCYKSFSLFRTKQKFCSSRCRLLYWAAGEIVKEYKAGSASGLVNLLRGLGKKDNSEEMAERKELDNK